MEDDVAPGVADLADHNGAKVQAAAHLGRVSELAFEAAGGLGQRLPHCQETAQSATIADAAGGRPSYNHFVAYVLVDFAPEIEHWSRGDTEHTVEHRVASPVAQPLGRPRRSGHVDEKHETLLLPGRVVEPGNEANEPAWPNQV
jgi:hypothetical protein